MIDSHVEFISASHIEILKQVQGDKKPHPKPFSKGEGLYQISLFNSEIEIPKFEIKDPSASSG